MHNVHHIDPDLDVSTAFCFHFGEVALSALFRAAQVLVIGPSLLAFAVYEVAFQTHTLFHHSDWRLHSGLERALCRVIVTPRMHGIHHSAIREENRSNFGVVFSFWDAVHRTLQLNVAQDECASAFPATRVLRTTASRVASRCPSGDSAITGWARYAARASPTRRRGPACRRVKPSFDYGSRWPAVFSARAARCRWRRVYPASVPSGGIRPRSGGTPRRTRDSVPCRASRTPLRMCRRFRHMQRR